MSTEKREELQEALCRYAADTLAYIDTVKGFGERNSQWILERESELQMMMDIKDRTDNGNISQSEEKGKAFLKYMKSKMSRVDADTRRAELEEELAAVLKGTLGGLEELERFLDAVEKLAVTSIHVFKENQVLRLPKGIGLDLVQVIITGAQVICPFLLEFKRDASVFFSPRLQNVDVLAYQLDKYIQTTMTICEKLDKSSFCETCPEMTMKPTVDLDVHLTEDDVQKMLDRINQLDNIRMNQDFRLVFLFKEESPSGFMDEFRERQPRMLQFLKDLEESAVKLDRMNTGAKISSVAGSSVGAVGGVLSIVGLALIPFTLGASLGLTIAGTSMAVTSGVNSLVTTATEIGVNHTEQKKASGALQSFMEDVQVLQDRLEKVTARGMNKMEVALGVGKMLFKAAVIGKGIDALVDASTVVRLIKSEEMVMNAGRVAVQEGNALRNIPRVASEIPDIGQAAAKGTLALSKSARAGLIAVNALFIGMDIFFICKDSISLSKGTKTEMSEFLRARAVLWGSEMDSFQKLYDSLLKGLLTSERSHAVLNKRFYPKRELKKTESEEEEETQEENQFCVIV